MDEASGRFHVLGNEEDELLAAKRSVHHPLPISGESFLAVLADIFVGDRGGSLVIPDQFLLVVGIARPLELRPLFRAKRGQENAKLVLVIVLDADGGMLLIGRFKEEALAGHRSGFEVAVKNESFGEVTVGCFVVSFHFRFLAVS